MVKSIATIASIQYHLQYYLIIPQKAWKWYLVQSWRIYNRIATFSDVHGSNRGGTLPFGIPQGPVVLRLSRKSSAYFLAGGYVRDTWPPVSLTRFTNTKNDNTRIVQAELSRAMAELTMAVHRLGIRFKWILTIGFKILCCYWMKGFSGNRSDAGNHAFVTKIL